ESTGDAAIASRSDLLEDIRAALSALRAQERIDPGRVMLVGHSEGAYLGPVVAAEDEEVAGLLAGAARPLDEITRWQIETILRQQGASDERIAAALEQEDEYIGFVERSAGEWSDYSLEDLQAEISWLTEEAAAQLLATPLGLSWLREHYLDDPEVTLRRVTGPVFVLNGEKDMQVPAAEGERIRALLEDAGNEDVTVHVLPDLNHLLRYHPEEPSLIFRHIAEPLDLRVIELLQEWAVARFGG
ncbi:alpha/beta hydrolase family protein, partial [Candidatus Bipolaricaulota bacterium]